MFSDQAKIGKGLSVYYSGGPALSKDVENWLSDNKIK